MRRFLWIALPLVLTAFALGLIWRYSERKISRFLIENIQDQTAKLVQWDVKMDDLQINLAPPSVQLLNVKLSPQKASTWIDPLAIKQIRVQIDFLNLLAGQIKISLLRAEGLHGGFDLSHLPQQDKKIDTLPINEIFNALDLLPVKMISLNNYHFTLRHDLLKEPLETKGELYLETNPEGISYGIKTTAQQKSQSVPALLLTKGHLSPKNLYLQKFDLRFKESHLGFDGEFLNFPQVIRRPQLRAALDCALEAEEIQSWFRENRLGPHWPKITGSFKTQGRVEVKNWHSPLLNLKAQINRSTLGGFTIGDLLADLQLKNHTLTFSEIALSHPAGDIHLKNGQWNLQKDQIITTASWTKMDLQELFQQIHLKSIPVDLKTAGRFECAGQLLSGFGIECKGKVEGSQLDVRPSRQSKSPPIVFLETFSGEGFVTISSNEVSYNSSLVLPHSKGHTQGVINFEKGFTIDFDSETFDFKDVRKIAGLEFEGQAKIQGRTQGNSQRATIDMALSATRFWFENYGLGDLETKINYNQGHLLIDAPKGKIFETQYLANLDIDLINAQISGLVEAPEVEAKDATYALQRRVPIPFSINGRGQARAQFSGPFSLGQLSYRFEGLLKKGEVAGETFNELKWDLQAKNGQVVIENNYIQKGLSLVTVKGKALPTGHIDLDITGHNLKIENSSFLSQYVKTLGGDLSFNMKMDNHILKPDILINGSVSHTTLGDADLPDSHFQFQTTPLTRSLDLDLLGAQAKMKLELPYNKNQSAQLQLKIDKFDFSSFIGLIIASPIRTEYQSLLSLDLQLKSANNDLFQSSGEAQIDQFYLSRGDTSIKNNRPMSITFDQGAATLKDLVLTGSQSEISAQGYRFTPEKLDVNILGKTDVRLFHLFFPFLEELSGPMKGQIHLTGKAAQPEIFGSLDLNEITLRIKGFPPLFDHISSHLEFSQKKINIEAIRGTFAGGQLAGDGTIDIVGVKDVRMDIRAQLRNIEIEVPEHIQSGGSADIVLSGHWFPYTLSGNYRVNHAFIDKDFTNDVANSNVRHSIYLPKNISESGFDPINLDLQIFLDKKIEIKTPQLAGFLTGQLQIRGTPQAPSLLGTIKTLPQAQLFFRDQQVFEVQSGLIKFTDTNEINPTLYFDAHSNVDKYEVNLLLQGRAKSPQFTLTSQPALDEQDIISLLALGMTTQKLDSQIESSQQAAQTGYQLGTAIISANPLNREIKESLGVDVKFSSAFDETKNLALPRVTISKDLIPRKLTATATSSFTENQNYDVRFQYLLNERLSTVVTYERMEGQDASASTGSNNANTSVFGLDLEYKREFK